MLRAISSSDTAFALKATWAMDTNASSKPEPAAIVQPTLIVRKRQLRNFYASAIPATTETATSAVRISVVQTTRTVNTTLNAVLILPQTNTLVSASKDLKRTKMKLASLTVNCVMARCVLSTPRACTMPPLKSVTAIATRALTAKAYPNASRPHSRVT